ncbi:hypothetical protein [Algoriphagus namhaensis]
MKKIVVILFLFPVLGFSQTSIIGNWELEENPETVWIFAENGRFYDDLGTLSPTMPPTKKTYSILNRSNSCNPHSTDPADMKYLRVDYGGGDTMCFYLETLSEEYLVLMDTYTGRLLIFKRKE